MRIRCCLAPALALALFACGGGSGPTAPETSIPAPSVAPAPAPVATTPAPAPTPDPNHTLFWEGAFTDPGVSWHFTNISGDKITWTAFTTALDDQLTVTRALTVTTKPGEQFADAFKGATCAQADISQGVARVGDRDYPAPFAHAYYDAAGHKTTAEAAVASCATKPCVPTWSRSEEHTTLYGDWITAENACSKRRTVTFRYVETNSCDKSTRTVDVKQNDETQHLSKLVTTGTFSVTSLSNAGSTYFVTKNTATVKSGIVLASGPQNTVLYGPGLAIDGANYCLKYDGADTLAQPAFYYYDFNTDSNETKAAVLADGGSWIGQFDGSHHHVGKTPVNHGNTWTVVKPGPDDVGSKFRTDAAVSGSDGIELIGCKTATCALVSAAWHGDVAFTCQTVDLCRAQD